MSLLMQALKKAERAKQNHHGDEEPAKPSEAFDQVLELAPHAVNHEPLTLSPLDMASPEPIPSFEAQEPPAAAQPQPQPRRPRNAPPAPPQPRIRARQRAMPVLSARAMRLGALGVASLIVAAVFGSIYWYEMYGAGSSRHLPPVPMPGVNLPAASAPAPGVPSLVGPASIAGGPADIGPAAAPIAAADVSAAPPAGSSYMSAPPPQAAEPPSSRDQMPPDAYMRGAEPLPPSPPGPTTRPARSAGAAAAVAAPAGSSEIRVARASNPEQIAPGIAAGYAAYGRGDMAGARQHYQDALRQDPNNRDAQLGLAAIALRAGEHEQAAGLYARLLDADPHDADAIAGMASLRGGDTGLAESRLRQAVERRPDSAPALFALGNLYAREGRWQEAQQQYFRAYTNAPQNADYAFNLAVGLDRLNQRRLALDYYQKALALAAGGSNAGHVSFERAAVSARVHELARPLAPRQEP